MSNRETALRNYRWGLFTEEQYEDALLQIDLDEMGISCPVSLIPELRDEWRAFCREPKKYEGTVIIDCVKQWIEDFWDNCEPVYAEEPADNDYEDDED